MCVHAMLIKMLIGGVVLLLQGVKSGAHTGLHVG